MFPFQLVRKSFPLPGAISPGIIPGQLGHRIRFAGFRFAFTPWMPPVGTVHKSPGAVIHIEYTCIAKFFSIRFISGCFNKPLKVSYRRLRTVHKVCFYINPKDGICIWIRDVQGTGGDEDHALDRVWQVVVFRDRVKRYGGWQGKYATGRPYTG